ncbi:MAG: peroxide stress protein YaaA [Lachnospiraceae bacterium]|jgi:cytoplasmic iron level regulating protein YaaA (DUF328/UPF0246 family)|nr:peroxide stress protein YaaA [Lachnospiraceae bacterium]
MKIIVSPAKKMRAGVEFPKPEGFPVFLSRTQRLLDCLRAMEYQELKTLWGCNDGIAGLNYERLKNMDLQAMGHVSAALTSYDGIQYQYMAPQVFTEEALRYVQEHLRILSGFYGILKPLDSVVPYRLEMQAKLRTDWGRNLYEYWGDLLYRELTREDSVILDLASAEYSRCIRRYLCPEDTFITCVFGELEDGAVKEKGVYVKMARGEMVRYLAEKRAAGPQEAKEFDRLGFRWREDLSDETRYVFVR